MRFQHSYRHFHSHTQIYKGEAWVSGQNSTEFAQTYAAENPKSLRDKITENTRESWQTLADDFNDDLNRIIEKAPHQNDVNLPQKVMAVESKELSKGVFAILKEQMPTLFPDTETIQFAYKYAMMQTDGKVNILERGDIIDVKKGRLTVSKPDGTQVYSTLIYPWDLYTGDTGLSTPVDQPAAVSEPAPIPTPEPENKPLDLSDPTGGFTPLPGTLDSPAPTPKKADSEINQKRSQADLERGLQLEAAWELNEAAMSKLAEKAGLTLKTEASGPNGNNKRVEVFNNEGVLVGEIEANVPLGSVIDYDRANNVQILAKFNSKSQRKDNLLDAMHAIIDSTQEARPSKEKVAQDKPAVTLSKDLTSEIALMKIEPPAELTDYNERHPERTAAIVLGADEKKEREFSVKLKFSDGSSREVAQVKLHPKYKSGELNKDNGATIVRPDGTEAANLDTAIQTALFEEKRAEEQREREDRSASARKITSAETPEARRAVIEGDAKAVEAFLSEAAGKLSGDEGYRIQKIVAEIRDNPKVDAYSRERAQILVPAPVQPIEPTLDLARGERIEAIMGALRTLAPNELIAWIGTNRDSLLKQDSETHDALKVFLAGTQTQRLPAIYFELRKQGVQDLAAQVEHDLNAVGWYDPEKLMLRGQEIVKMQPAAIQLLVNQSASDQNSFDIKAVMQIAEQLSREQIAAFLAAPLYSRFNDAELKQKLEGVLASTSQ